jgi:2-dehydro-3-deoxyphosphogluconate aldolase/(4S)-4-hydroxy-2-oxoglutarate aldolase
LSGLAKLNPNDPSKIGPYEIVARLGSGGMGVVFLGTLGSKSQEDVLDSAQTKNWPFLPGISTPSEAARMVDRGLSHVKAFPTDLIGGEKFLDAVAQVLPKLKILPSGGVNEQNLASLLAKPNVFAVSGSWIASKTDISERNFTQITERASRALDLATGNG